MKKLLVAGLLLTTVNIQCMEQLEDKLQAMSIDTQTCICNHRKDSEDIFDAARQGCCACVQKYITNIHATDNDGMMALHCATEMGHTEVCRLLLDRRADINAVDRNGRTALHRAAYNGHFEVCRLLLDRGAEINAVDRNGRTALHYAAYFGRTKDIRLLLDKGAKIHAIDKEGDMALHWAAGMGHTEVCQVLLDSGANIHATGKCDKTMLHCSAGHGHVEVCRLLLARGAKIDTIDMFQRTALHMAACWGHTQVCQLLLNSFIVSNEVRLVEHYNNFPANDQATIRTFLLVCHQWKKENIRTIPKILQNFILAKAAFCAASNFVQMKNDEDKTAYDLAENEEIRRLLKPYMPQ